MAKLKVRLLKPLNGYEIGSEAEYDEKDAKRLIGLGAVELVHSARATKAKPVKKAKASPVPANKMEAAALNKSADAATSPPAGGEASTEDDNQG